MSGEEKPSFSGEKPEAALFVDEKGFEDFARRYGRSPSNYPLPSFAHKVKPDKTSVNFTGYVLFIITSFLAGVESADQCLLNSKVLSCFSGVIMSIRSFFLYWYCWLPRTCSSHSVQRK